MTRPLTLAAGLLVVSVVLTAAPVEAQYMFLDFDGDGAYTPNDNYWWYGSTDSTNVDLYLVTDQNWDESPPDRAFDINAYAVNLFAHSAPATFLSVTNRMPGMTEVAPPAAYPYALAASYAGPNVFPPGRYRLMSMTVVFGSGCPNLEIVLSSCFSPPGLVTSFGSSYLSSQGDHTLRLGEDWYYAAGSLGCTDIPLHTPTVTCPGEVGGTVGDPIRFSVSVDAPDCYVDYFLGAGLPPGAALSSLGPIVYGKAEATFAWTPTAGQEGVYPITFEAENPDPFNGRWLVSRCVTSITVGQTNHAPVARPGGPYSGVQDVPVRFDASQSSDPDGDPLDYSWEFGDGGAGEGGVLLHTYTMGGGFTVVLRATDSGGLSDLDSTTATIARDIPVRIFTSASNDPTRLGRGKPYTCFQIEALPGSSLSPEQIDPISVFLRNRDPVCGELDAYTTSPKASAVGDMDHNGTAEYSACFSRDAMLTLGSCMPAGTHVARLELHGSLVGGDRIHGEVQHTFISGGTLQASITPNPMNAASTIEFTTSSAGEVRVLLFDIRGRLVATLFEEPSTAPGRHRVTLEGLKRSGNRFASGIYFVRMISEHDGEETRRVTILR